MTDFDTPTVLLLSYQGVRQLKSQQPDQAGRRNAASWAARPHVAHFRGTGRAQFMPEPQQALENRSDAILEGAAWVLEVQGKHAIGDAA